MSEVVISPVRADAIEPVTTTETPIAAGTTPTPAPGTPDSAAVDEPARDPSTGRFAKRTEQIQGQISTLTATKHQLAREIEQMTSRAHQLRKDLETPANIDPSDFDGQSVHNMRRAVKAETYEQTVQDVRSKQAQSHEVRAATFMAKVDMARETMPDLDATLRDFGRLPISDVTADIVADSSKAVEIAYYLAKNPDEARRIYSMPAAYQGVEIARIESRVSAPPKNRLSQAPAPVQTVSGGSGSAGVNLETADFATYEKTRLAQMNR
jgi:hypothetical protein